MHELSQRIWSRLKYAALALGVAAGLAGTADRASAQASTWDKIQSDKVIKVGVAQAEPWFFKDPATGQWTGIGPSYAAALAEAMGVKLELVEVTWGTAIAALQSSKIDLMPLLNITPKRALTVDYGNAPLAYSGLALLQRDGLNIKTWDQANDPALTIAVPHGASEDQFVTTYLSKAKVLRFPSYAEQLTAFQNGNADAVLLYHPTLAVMHGRVGKGTITIPTPFHIDSSDVAIRREPDKTFRDFLAVADGYFYNTGKTQEWYEAFLKSRGMDPSAVPGIQREAWTGVK
ncbi:transporter substrate-binding domain-containing protein [Ancylobacter sonchi]|uniref:transporter substrate-binding domain-containing protein n=1 Tax=Ancylobacter sonchi TaxID=1937790 RepID=UPI001BD696C3|nr:transporter substrate-binding domain-containing protein [Ancylobacter sonchi]MBS7532519.1 transporter substrate-binding domain-containing protein [Ancylobacter sonchi]